MSLKSGGIVILDFGSQTAQLIARRVRELGVYAALVRYDTTRDEADRAVPDFRGVILSGGPASVYEPGAPTLPRWVLEADLPVLGICYGQHLITQALGGQVEGAAFREYGQATIQITEPAGLFEGLDTAQTVWMSHGDRTEHLPDGFVSDGRPPITPLTPPSPIRPAKFSASSFIPKFSTPNTARPFCAIS